MSQVDKDAKFGAWTVLDPNLVRGKVKCACACGRSETYIRPYDLKTGASLMCRRCSVAITKGGNTTNPYASEHSSWTHMIDRCTNPKCKDYKNYGARGITVCELWLESFDAFLLDMGPKPDPTYTIDRTNVNGNYEPSNCTWLDRASQNRNQTSNVILELLGERKIVAEWARDSRCPDSVTEFLIHKRLSRGWSAEKAVFTPVKAKK